MNKHFYLTSIIIITGILSLVGWLVILNRRGIHILTTQHKPIIAVSIYPLYDIVRNVADPDQSVMLLIPPGEKPTEYKLTLENIQVLRRSRTLFLIGQGLEPWSDRLNEQLPDIHSVTVDAGVNIQTNLDYWLDIQNAIIITQNVANTLKIMDPTQTAVYQQRADVYKQKLSDLLSYEKKTCTNTLQKPKYGDSYGGSINTDTYLNLMKFNIDSACKQ